MMHFAAALLFLGVYVFKQKRWSLLMQNALARRLYNIFLLALAARITDASVSQLFL